ncbi:MAG: DUF3034 family protein [Rhodospirillaceae bacterium]|nr:DUF3034 family protein [Rhodospirillaceae bacterium]
MATSGVSQVEGAAGGGLVPWALIAGYGTRDGIGASAHLTHVKVSDFALTTGGVAVGFFDRVELSYARQWFDTGRAGARLGLGEDFTFHQDVVGAKVKLFGDAVFDQDRWWPQVSAGAQYKNADRSNILAALGARSDDGVDLYLAATKLFLAQSLLVNGTVRLTKANQFGILGFGGNRGAGYEPQLETSAALLVSRRLAVGAEFRTKPNNLAFAREQDAFDLFAAYFLNKNLSLTAAYVDLGDVALQGGQKGVYLSIQAGF